MVLGFKQYFPNGDPTFFASKIMASVVFKNSPFRPKIHTIRSGERWRAGMSIQMAYGVRTKEYEQFNEGIKGLDTCISVQTIWMHYAAGGLTMHVDDDQLYDADQGELFVNDGLTRLQFINWFFPLGEGRFSGQIIHWTDFKY